MKKLVCALLFVGLVIGLNGQNETVELKPEKRYNALLINGLFGSSKTGLGIRYKSLYSINDLIKIGWGTGIESYSSTIERNFIPISFDVMGDISPSSKTPFYMVSIGYGIPLQEDEDFAQESSGGLMVDLSIGYRTRSGDSQPFIGAGYRLQNATYRGEDRYGNDNKDVIYKRWSLSVGLLF